MYGAADVARMRRKTPDFHTVSFGALITNRAHDRGYLRWSTGWSSGTERIRRVKEHWVVEQISMWIT